MPAGDLFLKYLLATVIILFTLLILWAILDKFPRLKKIRDYIENLMDSI
jgi:hypothetical protein